MSPVKRSPISAAQTAYAGLLGILATTACGGIVSPEEAPRPTLFAVQGTVTGSLGDDSPAELRAALAWSVYSDELIDCVEAVEVTGPINWSTGEDDETIGALQRCINFSDRGRSETASVPLSASFPAAFEIPVDALPDPSLLSGNAGARVGIAGVLIYTDDNGNRRFDETALGALDFVDTVRGTSFPISDEATSISYLIYREGEVSPLWKLFTALYGCAEPELGFQTMTVSIDNSLGEATCILDDRQLNVALAPGLETLGCAEDPIRDDYVQPGAQGLDAGSAAVCDDFGDLLVTSQAGSVCPSFRRYALVGCSDLSSADACRQTYWDIQNTPPSWWPCQGGADVTTVRVFDHHFATDANGDALFSLSFTRGVAQIDPNDVEVEIIVGGIPVRLPRGAVTLVDNDGNGVFNFGDVLTVREVNNEFTTESPLGAYAVTLHTAGVVIPAQGGYAPVPTPDVTPIEISAVDAEATITDGIDDIAIVTYEGDGVGHPFAALSITMLVGGELPLTMSAANGGLLVAEDLDGDGLFEPGDSFLVRDTNIETFGSLSTEMIRSFGGFLYLTLQVEVGEGIVVPLANNGFVEVQ